MSRIGKQPIELPSGVNVEISGNLVKISGKKGALERRLPAEIKAAKEGNSLIVTRINESNDAKSKHGLIRTLLNNMVIGVSTGYKKELAVVGIGYKMLTRAGGALSLNVGYSHPIEYCLPQGITAKVEAGTKLMLEGCDKELLGEVSAQIRKLREPEPYKGKGIRYSSEVIKKKAGKAVASASK